MVHLNVIPQGCTTKSKLHKSIYATQKLLYLLSGGRRVNTLWLGGRCVLSCELCADVTILL